MKIAQSRVDEDVLAVGDKQMTEALYSSESQPPVFNNPEHDFIPVPGAHTQSCDLWVLLYWNCCIGIEVATFFVLHLGNPMNTPRRFKHRHQWAMGTDISGQMTRLGFSEADPGF